MTPEEEITHMKELGQIIKKKKKKHHIPSMINYTVDSY